MSTTPHRQGRAIIAVCTALVTLAVGLIVALMTAKSAEAERARADAEAMAAESRAMSEVAEQSAESNRAALEGTAESILKIADALDADDPNAARIYTIDALGAIVGELDDPAAALDMWSRIIDLTEELDEDIQRRVLGFAADAGSGLADAAPDDPAARLHAARIRTRLGALDRIADHFEATRQLDAARELVGDDTSAEAQAILADAELALGEIDHRMGRSADALAHFETAVNIREAALASATETDRLGVLLGVAVARERMASANIEEKQWTEAERYLVGAAEARRTLAEESGDPERRREYASTCFNLSRFWTSRIPDPARAAEMMQSSVSEMESLVADHPDVQLYRENLAGVLLGQATAEQRVDPAASIPIWERRGEMLDDAIGRCPEQIDYTYWRAQTHEGLGKALLADGQTALAKQEFLTASHVFEMLVNDFPDQSRFRTSLARAKKAYSDLRDAVDMSPNTSGNPTTDP